MLSFVFFANGTVLTVCMKQVTTMVAYCKNATLLISITEEDGDVGRLGVRTEPLPRSNPPRHKVPSVVGLNTRTESP